MSHYEHVMAMPVTAAHASADARANFIAKTYLHLAGAIFAFIALTGTLVQTSIGVSIAHGFAQHFLVVLVLFMVVGWVARSWARNSKSLAMQYAGLGLYVVAESVIFLPLIAYARDVRPDAILPAAVITLAVFGGLTAFVFVTRKNFSFMGSVLCVCGLVSVGAVFSSLIFGFSLGIVFSGLMILLAAGYILYDTSAVMHEYPIGSHVAASLALFASVALMFWYVLRIFMSRD